MLIFDEVITGFRLGLAGAQGRSASSRTCPSSPRGRRRLPGRRDGRRRDIMASSPKGTVSMAGTYSANGIAVAAANAALDELNTPGFYESSTRSPTVALRLEAC